jgi:hypothetical protein
MNKVPKGIPYLTNDDANRSGAKAPMLEINVNDLSDKWRHRDVVKKIVNLKVMETKDNLLQLHKECESCWADLSV